MSDFVEALQASKCAVRRMAQHLADKHGCPVTVMPVYVRPDVSQRLEYADNGDIYLGMRAEVRHLALDFTCSNDFPYDVVICCDVEIYKRARPKPMMFYVVNRMLTHYAYISGTTKTHWVIRAIANRRNSVCDAYLCPKHLVTFHVL
jgi:hypothetical protein